MNAAKRRLSSGNCRLQGSDCQTRVDGPANGVAGDETRPGIKNDGDIDEARRQRHIGDVANPELVRAVQENISGQIRTDRPAVTTVRRCYEAAPHLRLQIVLAHQAPDLLMIDDRALLPQRSCDPAVAVVRVAESHLLNEIAQTCLGPGGAESSQ